MTLTSLYLFLSTLSVSPERSQFRRYETIVLSCVANSTGWTVKRNTSLRFNQDCQFSWGIPKESSCRIDTSYPSDSGVYWCENDHGESSNAVNLTVTSSAVILEIPPNPVMEGDTVTLSCSFKNATQTSSNFPANFYKDGSPIGTGKAGKMTISGISKSQGGFYKCEHASEGGSPESQLTVREKVHHTTMAATPTSSATLVSTRMSQPSMICKSLIFILYIIPSICGVYKYRKWSKGRAVVKA